MDEKGFISIEYLFSLFILLIIALGLLFYASSAIESSFNIENNVNHRIILDSVADEISQVNSNGPGYSKRIKLDSQFGYYEITVDKRKLTIEYENRKGETPISLLNIDSKYRMYSGNSYLISKNEDGKIVIT